MLDQVGRRAGEQLQFVPRAALEGGRDFLHHVRDGAARDQFQFGGSGSGRGRTVTRIIALRSPGRGRRGQILQPVELAPRAERDQHRGGEGSAHQERLRRP